MMDYSDFKARNNSSNIIFNSDKINYKNKKKHGYLLNCKKIYIVKIIFLIVFAFSIFISYKYLQLKNKIKILNSSSFYDNNNRMILEQIFFPYKSGIIYNLEELNLLREWLGNSSAMSLIYTSKINSDDSDKFNKRLYNVSSFLVLVKTKSGNRFGGYTSKNFMPLYYSGCRLEIEKEDNYSFVFNLDKRIKFPIKNNKSSVLCDENIFVGFGVCDFLIKNHFFNNLGFSNFPSSYNDLGYGNLALTNGEEKFVVDELEIYHVYNLNLDNK